MTKEIVVKTKRRLLKATAVFFILAALFGFLFGS